MTDFAERLVAKQRRNRHGSRAALRRDFHVPVDNFAYPAGRYDATAEAQGITLVSEIEGQPVTLGDKNLLTSALMNLTDNALKYAGSGATVRVCATQHRDTVSMIVQDNGPGIPSAERARVVERFYRLDQSRSLPGNGLGLSIVAATASLHWGKLELADAAPGLVARIVLPLCCCPGWRPL